MAHNSVQVEHLLLGLFSDQAGIPGRVFADFGLTVKPVRGQVRERLGRALSSLPEGRLPFSPQAKEALRSGNRIGMGAPGTGPGTPTCLLATAVLGDWRPAPRGLSCAVNVVSDRSV